MINDFKLGLKIIKYGLNLKGCVFVSVLFVTLGIFMDVAVPESPINGMYIGMGGMMMVQLICSVSVSAMVQSSSRKRQLQTSVPAIVCGGYLLLSNTISILAKFIGFKFLEWELADIANGILFSAVLVVLMVLYMGGALKAFWQATICFCIFYVVYYSLSMSLKFWNGGSPFILPIGAAVAVSYVMVIVATVLMYFLFAAMYKRDFSRQNFETQLKRAK